MLANMSCTAPPELLHAASTVARAAATVATSAFFCTVLWAVYVAHSIAARSRANHTVEKNTEKCLRTVDAWADAFYVLLSDHLFDAASSDGDASDDLSDTSDDDDISDDESDASDASDTTDEEDISDDASDASDASDSTNDLDGGASDAADSSGDEQSAHRVP
jgi:hypothetical protein